mgnify:FL=1
MLYKINPIETESWKNLRHHFEKMKDVHMKDLFNDDAERFRKYSVRYQQILVDYSKNIITEETLQMLTALADEVGLRDAIGKAFAGDRINETEDREFLHTAL